MFSSKWREEQTRSTDRRGINLSACPITTKVRQLRLLDRDRNGTRMWGNITCYNTRIEVVAFVKDLEISGKLPASITVLHIINPNGFVDIINDDALLENRIVCINARRLSISEKWHHSTKGQQVDGIYQLSEYAGFHSPSEMIFKGYLNAPSAFFFSFYRQLCFDGIVDCTTRTGKDEYGKLDVEPSIWGDPLISPQATVAVSTFRPCSSQKTLPPVFTDELEDYFAIPEPLLHLPRDQKIRVPNPRDERLHKKIVIRAADGTYPIDMADIPERGEVIYFFSHFEWILYSKLFTVERELPAIAALVRSRDDQLYLIARTNKIHLINLTPNVIKLLRLDNPNGDIIIDDARLIDQVKVLLNARNFSIKHVKHLPEVEDTEFLGGIYYITEQKLTLEGIYHVAEQAYFPRGEYGLIVNGHLNVVYCQLNAEAFLLNGTLIVENASETAEKSAAIEAPFIEQFKIGKTGKLYFHEFADFIGDIDTICDDEGTIFHDAAVMEGYYQGFEKYVTKPTTPVKECSIVEPGFSLGDILHPPKPVVHELYFTQFPKEVMLMPHTNEGIPELDLSCLPIKDKHIICFIDPASFGQKTITPIAMVMRIGDQLQLISSSELLNLTGKLPEGINELWVSNPEGTICVDSSKVLHRKKIFLKAKKLIYIQENTTTSQNSDEPTELVLEGHYQVEESIHFYHGSYDLLIKGFLKTSDCFIDTQKVCLTGSIVASREFRKREKPKKKESSLTDHSTEEKPDYLYITKSGVLFSPKVLVETNNFVLDGAVYADHAEIKALHFAKVMGQFNNDTLPGRSLSIASRSQFFGKDAKVVAAKLNLSEAAISICIRGLLSGVEITIQGEKIQFALGSEIFCVLLDCRSKLADCLGKISTQRKVSFIVDTLVTYPESIIAHPDFSTEDETAPKTWLTAIEVRGNTWHNASDNITARVIDVKTNYSVIHGYVPGQGVKKTVLSKANFHAQNLSITTPIFIKLGSISARQMQVVSLLNFGLGIVHANSYVSNSFIKADCSVNLPYLSSTEEIATIFKDVMNFNANQFHQFLMGDFLRYLTRAASLLLPNVRIPIAVGVSLVTLVLRAPKIIYECMLLYRRKDPVQIYQLLDPLVGMKEVLFLGNQVCVMSQGFKLGVDGELFSKLTAVNDFANFNAPSDLLSMGFELFGPVHTSTAVLKLEAGLSLTANAYNKSLLELNLAKANAAINRSSQALYRLEAFSAGAALDFQFVGGQLCEKSVARISGNQTVSVDTYQQDGATLASTARFTAKKGSHSGTFKITKRGIVDEKNFTNSGEVDVTGTMLKTDKLQLIAGSKTHATESYVQYEDAELGDKFSLTRSTVESDNLDPDQFLAHEGEYKHVEVSDSVALITDQETHFTRNHQLDHSVYVKAPAIEVDSKMKTSKGRIDLIANEEKFSLTERGHLEMPKGGTLAGKAGVTMKGKADLGGKGVIESEGKAEFLGESSDTQARDLYIHARDVNIKGARTTGKKSTVIKLKGKGEVKIEAEIHKAVGRHGEPVYIYRRGQVAAGEGGLLLDLPEGSLLLRASDLKVEGRIVGRAKYFEGVPETHQFIVDEGSESSFLGMHRKEWKEIDTWVERSRMTSGSGIDIKVSKKAKTIAVDVIAPKSKARIAGGDEGTEILDVVTKRHRVEDDSWFGGIASRHTERSGEDSRPTLVIAKRGVLGSPDSVVTTSRGTVAYTEVEIEFEGKKIHLCESVLNDDFTEEKRGFYISVSAPGVSYDSRSDFSTGIHDPLVDSFQRLSSSDGGETVNLADIGLKARDLVRQIKVNNAKNGGAGGFLEERYLGGDNPKSSFRFELGYGVTRTEMHSQRTSNGRMMSPGFTMRGTEATITGTPVDAEEVTLDVQDFKQESIPLYHSSSSGSVGLGVGINGTGQFDANIGVAKSNGHGTTHQLQRLRYSKRMHINEARRWTLDGAIAEGPELTGSVDEVDIRSKLDTQSSSSFSASVGSSGNFSCFASSNREEKVSERSGINVGDASGFTARHRREFHPVGSSHHIEIGLSGNAQDLVDLFTKQQDPSEVPVEEAIPVENDASSAEVETETDSPSMFGDNTYYDLETGMIVGDGVCRPRDGMSWEENRDVIIPSADTISLGRNRWSMFGGSTRLEEANEECTILSDTSTPSFVDIRWSMFASNARSGERTEQSNSSLSDYGIYSTEICNEKIMSWCSRDLAFDGLQRRPGPGGDWRPVENGQVTKLFVGPIQTFVDPVNRTVYNVALDKHLLSGIVKRQVTVDKYGWVYITTEKKGEVTFFNLLAKPVSRKLWREVDLDIREWMYHKATQKQSLTLR